MIPAKLLNAICLDIPKFTYSEELLEEGDSFDAHGLYHYVSSVCYMQALEVKHGLLSRAGGCFTQERSFFLL